MTHEIPWNKTLLEDFIQEGLLTEDEEFIIRTRLAGWSQVKQSMERNISTATVSIIVRRLKNKYDALHKQDPIRFPKRKKSSVELILDNTKHDTTLQYRLPCDSCEYFKHHKSAKDLLNCTQDCHYKKYIKN